MYNSISNKHTKENSATSGNSSQHNHEKSNGKGPATSLPPKRSPLQQLKKLSFSSPLGRKKHRNTAVAEGSALKSTHSDYNVDGRHAQSLFFKGINDSQGSSTPSSSVTRSPSVEEVGVSTPPSSPTQYPIPSLPDGKLSAQDIEDFLARLPPLSPSDEEDSSEDEGDFFDCRYVTPRRTPSPGTRG